MTKNHRKPKSNVNSEEKALTKKPTLADTKGTFFSRKTHDCGALVNQPVINVNVTIEQADDGIAECLTGCFSACLGIGKAAGGA